MFTTLGAYCGGSILHLHKAIPQCLCAFPPIPFPLQFLQNILGNLITLTFIRFPSLLLTLEALTCFDTTAHDSVEYIFHGSPPG